MISVYATCGTGSFENDRKVLITIRRVPQHTESKSPESLESLQIPHVHSNHVEHDYIWSGFVC